MAFLTNRAINRVTLHTGIHALAMGAGGLFVMAYLLTAGVPIVWVLVAQSAIVFGRYLIRPAVVPLAEKLGLRNALAVGTVAYALQYLFIPAVQGLDWALVAVVVISAVGNALYWTCFHAYFAALGDAEGRGRQLGVREAVTAVTGIVAPLIGAFLITRAGPWPAFLAVTVVHAAAALPLIGLPNLPVQRSPLSDPAPSRRAAVILGADAFFTAGYYYVWQIALFVTLGRSFTALGGAEALAALVGAVAGLALGSQVDSGKGRSAVVLAYSVGLGVLLLRGFSIETPWLAVAANALGPLVVTLMTAPLYAPIYNAAQASGCPLRFHVRTEGGWDIGTGVGCLAAAGLIAAGAPMWASILVGLPGLLFVAVALWRRYE